MIFINGIWTPGFEANKYKDRLKDTLVASGVSPDCVRFELSHSQNDGVASDLVETILQKSTEFGVQLSHAVRMFLRLVVPDDWFLAEVIDAVYSRNVGDVEDPQLDKHVEKVRAFALREGRRAIIVTHSQGGFYGNAIWHRLTPAEQANTRLVSVVTPADNVADGGANTRLSGDAFAGLFFPFALAANVSNAELFCEHGSRDRWLCHGFETAYLYDSNSRGKIIRDVLAALPEEEPPGALVEGRVISAESGTGVGALPVYLIYPFQEDSEEEPPYFQTLTDANGFYRFSGVPACEGCVLFGSQGSFACAGGFDFQFMLEVGMSYTFDLSFGEWSYCLPS